MKVVSIEDAKNQALQECADRFEKDLEHVAAAGPLKGYAIVGLHKDGSVSTSFFGDNERFSLLGGVAHLQQRMHSALLDEDDGD